MPIQPLRSGDAHAGGSGARGGGVRRRVAPQPVAFPLALLARVGLPLVAVALLGSAAPASADPLVAITVRAPEGRLPADTEQTARRWLRDTLSSSGMTVVTPPDSLARCPSSRCIASVVRQANIDFVASAQLLRRDGAARFEPGRVVVTFTDGQGVQYEASAAVVDHEGELEGALRAAFVEARRKVLRGPGPFLVVEGEPAGATVHVDGTEVGAVPHDQDVEPGPHAIEVRHQGYRAMRRHLVIPDTPLHEERLTVDLDEQQAATTDAVSPVASAEGAEDAPPPRGAARKGGSLLHLIGPAALGAAGLVGLSAALGGIIRGGCDEVDAMTNECLRGPGRTNWASVGAWGGFGLAALGGAALWLVMGPALDGPNEPATGTQPAGASELRRTIRFGLGFGSAHLRGSF